MFSQRYRIALTYANDACTDGAGAQLHRIYGVYALSRFFAVPYVHSPLTRVKYQGLGSLEDGRNDPEYHEKFNRVFRIASDVQSPQDAVSLYLRKPDVETIAALKQRPRNERTFRIVRILMPHAIGDQHPEIYNCVKSLSPFAPPEPGRLRIAVHVRRGELLAVESWRMLPNAYYVRLAMEVAQAAERAGIQYVCDLYTEVPSSAFTVKPDHPGVIGRLARPVAITSEMSGLGDFDTIPNLRRRVNLDPIETLREMATADVLIMSRSSYSYLAAIFSRGIVIYHPFWHKPLAEWLIADPSGHVSPEKLAERLEPLKR